MQRLEVVPWSIAAMNGPCPWDAMPAVWASVTVCSWESVVEGLYVRRVLCGSALRARTDETPCS
ncbi:hypothetical protein GCM10022232_79030 [Streptomyces plumbiresistens]|uniref:Transposase n=1 Tax=Streptomyces plumbiresistens TaxID=511811 RepID=A0ABP7T824_9ACTN